MMTGVKLLSGLRRFFWTAGWVYLAVTVLAIGGAIYQQVQTRFVSVPGLDVEWANSARLLMHFQSFAGSLSEIFFAFLMSTVFGMLARETVSMERANRFLKITCCAFLLQSLLGMSSWVFTFKFKQLYCGSEGCDLGGMFFLLTSEAIALVMVLSPVLYAVTIYVLYNHFTRMVQFEAEVV
jgi:hypothetical protein